LFGLMQSEKRNMERMVEAVPDSDYQVMQNFLTHSSWEHRGVMDRTASNANLYALIELVLPGGFGDGVAVVALSPAEKWSWLRPIAGGAAVVLTIGESFAFQCGGVCGSECGRFDDRIETLDF